MAKAEPPAFAVQRPHRADAARNFDALLVAARAAFAEHGSQASLEDIARDAGVAIGTLYRNFPTRQHLYNAVFSEQVEQLCQVAREVGDLPPWEALVTWLRRFVTYEATKRALQEGLDRNSGLFRAASQALTDAGTPLLTRAQEVGDVRPDTNYLDVIRMIVGVTTGTFIDDEQQDRVLAIVLDGIRARGTKPSSPATTSSAE